MSKNSLKPQKIPKNHDNDKEIKGNLENPRGLMLTPRTFL
jgi:hypothetical protein